jgi:hypothetical protein
MSARTRGNPWGAFVTLAALGMTAPGCDDITVPPTNPVAHSIVLNPTSIVVADGAETNISATVYDQNGDRMSPQPGLTWSTVDPAVATAAEGRVRGEFPGQTLLRVSVNEISAEAEVLVTAAATALQQLEGDAQRGGPGEALPGPLTIRVVDRHGNAVQGIEVEFSVEAGGGSISPARQTSDASGEVRSTWTLGPANVINRAAARLVEGAVEPVHFTASVVQETTVSDGGGEFETSGGEVAISFPAGAVSGETQISVEPAAPQTAAPAGATAIEGTSYRFEPSGITFSHPVEITISYEGATLPAGVRAEDLRIMRESSSGWEVVGSSSVDAGAKVVRGAIYGFSTYAIMAVSTAAVTVEVSALEPRVTQLRLAVAGAGILTPIESELAITNGAGIGTIELPAGDDRTFTVRGFDAGGTMTHRGSISANVTSAPEQKVTVQVGVLHEAVSVTSELPGEHVTAMMLSVSGSGIAQAITTAFIISGATATASVEVPAGSDRTFTVHGLDAQDNVTHQGAATAHVVQGTPPEVKVSLAPVMASVRMTAALPASLVEEMHLVVTGPGISTPVEAALVIVDGIGSATVQIPAGLERTFTVRALDGEGAITHRGSTISSVVAGVETNVSVDLDRVDGSVTVVITVGQNTLTLETHGASIRVGETRQFTATVHDAAGEPVEDAVLRWASANPALATVNAEGNVTGRRVGDTRISVSYNGFAASASLTIEP